MDRANKNREIAKKVVEAFGSGDLATIREYVHEDVDWQVLGIGTMTRAEVLQAAGNVAVGTISTSMTIANTIAQDDRVAVEAVGDMQFANGISYCNSYCFTFRLADGMVIETREYLDTALIERTFGTDPLRAIG